MVADIGPCAKKEENWSSHGLIWMVCMICISETSEMVVHIGLVDTYIAWPSQVGFLIGGSCQTQSLVERNSMSQSSQFRGPNHPMLIKHDLYDANISAGSSY
jgi:hypothetical protein